MAGESDVKGRIKWADANKGFGFVTPLPPDAGEDIFLHASALPEGMLPIQNDLIEFEIGIDRRTGRTRAERVELV
jgi:CspA family cold shock protein